MLSLNNITAEKFIKNSWAIYLDWDHDCIEAKLIEIFSTLPRPRDFKLFQPKQLYDVCGQVYYDFMLHGFHCEKFWNVVSELKDLTNFELYENRDHLNWQIISLCYRFSNLEIEQFRNYIDFSALLHNHFVSLDMKKKYVAHYSTDDVVVLKQLELICYEKCG